MMNLNQITLEPLKKISPSQFTRLKKCPYSSILSNSINQPLLPYTPSNHLGTIIHKCIRKIYTGVIITEKAFEQAWEEFEKEEERVLLDLGFKYFLPLKENVSGYTIKKLQVKSIFKKRLNKSEIEDEKDQDIEFKNEHRLQSEDTLIAGSVDHILIINDFVKLIDTKTGDIFNEEGEVKEAYKEQLKLYAYLYYEEYGKHPDELAIRDLNHNETAIPFTKDECDALAVTAKDKLKIINKSILNNDLENLANPSIEICNKCLYRPACKYYWKLDTDNSNNIFADVRGKLNSINQYKNGNINITLENNSYELIVTHLEDDNLELLQNLKGVEVGIYNVNKCSSDRIYKSTKWTAIYEV